MWRAEDENLTTEQVIAELKNEQGERSLREYANDVGCSASYLSQVYNGIRQPSEKLLSRLNLETKTTYTRTRRWK